MLYQRLMSDKQMEVLKCTIQVFIEAVTKANLTYHIYVWWDVALLMSTWISLGDKRCSEILSKLRPRCTFLQNLNGIRWKLFSVRETSTIKGVP